VRLQGVAVRVYVCVCFELGLMGQLLEAEKNEVWLEIASGGA